MRQGNQDKLDNEYLGKYFYFSRSWYVDDIRSKIILSVASAILFFCNTVSIFTLTSLGYELLPIKSSKVMVSILSLDVDDVISISKIDSEYENPRYKISKVLIENYIKQRHEFKRVEKRTNELRNKIFFVKSLSSTVVAKDFLSEFEDQNSIPVKFLKEDISCEVDIKRFQFKAAQKQTYLEKIKHWFLFSDTNYAAKVWFKERCSDSSDVDKVAFIEYKFTSKAYSSSLSSESLNEQDMMFLVNRYIIREI